MEAASKMRPRRTPFEAEYVIGSVEVCDGSVEGSELCWHMMVFEKTFLCNTIVQCSSLDLGGILLVSLLDESHKERHRRTKGTRAAHQLICWAPIMPPSTINSPVTIRPVRINIILNSHLSNTIPNNSYLRPLPTPSNENLLRFMVLVCAQMNFAALFEPGKGHLTLK